MVRAPFKLKRCVFGHERHSLGGALCPNVLQALCSEVVCSACMSALKSLP